MNNTRKVGIMIDSDKIREWESLADERKRAPRMNRISAAPPTPASRIFELEAEIMALKRTLAEACTELRLLSLKR